MQVDIGNALADTADPGISRDSLDRLDAEVAAAHDRIAAGRDNDAYGYAALNLPAETDPEQIRSATAPVANADTVLTVGIGGSALGATAITSAVGAGNHYVLDNIDPVQTERVLDSLSLAETAVNIVSRSGTTVETLANFFVVRDAMETAGVDWTERTVVTTGTSGPLRRLVDRHDLPALDVPTGVPGRFSALSAVGLVPAAIHGLDLEGLLAGAERAANRLTGSLFDCPAYAYGAVIEALSRRGVMVTAMMPYAEALEPFAEWFAQLWAESLGKDGLGETPVRALGATDQHAQLQLYRAGPRNTAVTFVRPRDRDDRAIPDPGDDELAYLQGESLGSLLDAELRATEASLATAGRPSIRIEVPRIDANGLGELLYGMEAACVLSAELKGVNAFDQPAVEWGKRVTRSLLRDEDTEETRAVAAKTTLRV